MQLRTTCVYGKQLTSSKMALCVLCWLSVEHTAAQESIASLYIYRYTPTYIYVSTTLKITHRLRPSWKQNPHDVPCHVPGDLPFPWIGSAYNWTRDRRKISWQAFVSFSASSDRNLTRMQRENYRFLENFQVRHLFLFLLLFVVKVTKMLQRKWNVG